MIHLFTFLKKALKSFLLVYFPSWTVCEISWEVRQGQAVALFNEVVCLTSPISNIQTSSPGTSWIFFALSPFPLTHRLLCLLRYSTSSSFALSLSSSPPSLWFLFACTAWVCFALAVLLWCSLCASCFSLSQVCMYACVFYPVDESVARGIGFLSLSPSSTGDTLYVLSSPPRPLRPPLLFFWTCGQSLGSYFWKSAGEQ